MFFGAKKCSTCEALLLPGKTQCGACGSWQDETATAPAIGALKPLSTIKTAVHERIATGVWDRCFGPHEPPYGVAKTCRTLVGGARGAGKSTFLLQWCAGFLATVSIAARDSGAPLPWIGYLNCEEAAEDINARLDRLSLSFWRDQVRAVDSLEASTHLGILEGLAKLDPLDKSADRPAAIVLDSISALVGDSREGYAYALKLIQKITKETCLCPAMIVIHLTKTDAFAGPEAAHHDVDHILGIEVSVSSDLRFFHPSKNRYGPAGASAEVACSMTPLGLVPFTGESQRKTYENGVDVTPPKAPKKKRAP